MRLPEFDSPLQLQLVLAWRKRQRTALVRLRLGFRVSPPDPFSSERGIAAGALVFQTRDASSTLAVRSIGDLRLAARTRRCQRRNIGSTPIDRSKFGSLVITGARFPCKEDVGVQFPGDPPDVAVAEWFRRLAVNQSTRVRFSPVTPCGRSSRDRMPRS